MHKKEKEKLPCVTWIGSGFATALSVFSWLHQLQLILKLGLQLLMQSSHARTHEAVAIEAATAPAAAKPNDLLLSVFVRAAPNGICSAACVIRFSFKDEQSYPRNSCVLCAS